MLIERLSPPFSMGYCASVQVKISFRTVPHAELLEVHTSTHLPLQILYLTTRIASSSQGKKC